MQRRLTKAVAIAGTMAISMLGSAPPALADWQTKDDGRGSSYAQACVSTASRHCVRLQCLAIEGGGMHWGIDAREPGYSAESASVTWAIDGATVSITMNKAGPADDGVQGYDAAFDQATHQRLIQLLKGGNDLTISSDQFAAFSVSLRGSSAALTRLLAQCPLTTATEDTSGTAPAEKFGEPFEAVLTMAAKQGCEATEEEIFEAITSAAFSAWEANQFVAMGAEDGTLTLIDRTNFKYRIAECKAKDSALVVDAGATELAITAEQMPQPVSAAVNDIAAMCGDAFRTEGRSESAFLAEDIDGDGTYDFLLDQAQFCPDAVTTMCGASHCPLTLFVSADGAWRRFDFIVQGFEEFSPKGFLLQCGTPGRKAGVFMEGGKLVQRNC